MSEESKRWYRETRPLFNSGFEDDEFWAYGQDGFHEVLSSFLGEDVQIFDKTLYSIPQRVRAIVQQKVSDVYNSTVFRQIICDIGILRCGQYVKAQGAYWIVSSMPDNNRIFEKAILWKCKHTIRFLSPITGKVVEYPVYSTNSTQYGTGVAEKMQLDVGEDQHLIYLPYNEETILLDDGFRFIMDKNRFHPTVYHVTRVDPVTYAVGNERYDDGLIQWAVLEDQFNEATDSREEMIADFVKILPGSTDVVSGTNASLTLTDMDGDYSVALGELKQIQVACADADGNAVTPVVYQLDYDFSDDVASVTDDGSGTITVQVKEDCALVGRQIELRVENTAIGSKAAIQLQIIN